MKRDGLATGGERTTGACVCGATRGSPQLHGTWTRAGYEGIPFTVVRCARCALARTEPVPDTRVYARGESDWSGATHDDVWSAPLARSLRRELPGRRLIDVGCNRGHLVAAAAAAGFDALGIDLDPVAIAEGRSHGRNILNLPVADLVGEFDVLVLHHVLEHVVGVAGFLGHCARLLAPGGTAVIHVPYHRGLVPRLMGDHWFAYAPNEHVWHFTPATLTATVEGCTPLRRVTVRTKGAIEPPSSGAKGAVKRIIAQTASRLGWGDEIRARFRMSEEGAVSGPVNR